MPDPRKGPIDPQIGGIPAHGIIDEFKRAMNEIADAKGDQRAAKVAVWQPIIAKHQPTLIGECQNAISWSTSMAADWLKTGMFHADSDAEQRAARIVEELGSHEITKSHSRHIPSSS